MGNVVLHRSRCSMYPHLLAGRTNSPPDIIASSRYSAKIGMTSLHTALGRSAITADFPIPGDKGNTI